MTGGTRDIRGTLGAMNVRALAVSLLVVASLAGCSPAPAATTPAATAPAATSGAAAPAALGETVDAAGFVQLVNTPGVVVLDVRTPAEFASGHLEGAVNIDIESQDFATRVGELDRSVTYAVYCRSGNRSAAALTVMKELGFTGLHHLAGGIGAWQRAGQPVVR